MSTNSEYVHFFLVLDGCPLTGTTFSALVLLGFIFKSTPASELGVQNIVRMKEGSLSLAKLTGMPESLMTVSPFAHSLYSSVPGALDMVSNETACVLKDDQADLADLIKFNDTSSDERVSA